MIEIYQSVKSSKWYWRYRASNGKITCDGSEGYHSKWNAKRAARRTGFALVVARSKEV